MSFVFIFNVATPDVFALDNNNQVAALAFLTATPTVEPWNEEGVILVSEGETYTYSSQTNIKLLVSWSAEGSISVLQSLMDELTYTAFLDGVYLPGSGGYYTDIFEWGDKNRFDYYYELGTLSPGTYNAGVFTDDQ